MSLPWEPNFVPPSPDANLLNTITQAAEAAAQEATQVATDIGSSVATQVGGPTAGAVVSDVGAAAQAAEQAGGAIITSVTGGGGTGASGYPTPSVPGLPTSIPGLPTGTVVTSLGAAIKASALEAAEKAALAALPDLQKKAEEMVTGAITGEVIKVTGGLSVPQPPAVGDFIKADARSRAIRTFLVGLGMSVVLGLVTALGQSSGLNWFSKEGWTAVATLAVSSVVGSVLAYVTRMIKEPAHTAALLGLNPHEVPADTVRKAHRPHA